MVTQSQRLRVEQIKRHSVPRLGPRTATRCRCRVASSRPQNVLCCKRAGAMYPGHVPPTASCNEVGPTRNQLLVAMQRLVVGFIPNPSANKGLHVPSLNVAGIWLLYRQFGEVLKRPPPQRSLHMKSRPAALRITSPPAGLLQLQPDHVVLVAVQGVLGCRGKATRQPRECELCARKKKNKKKKDNNNNMHECMN